MPFKIISLLIDAKTGKVSKVKFNETVYKISQELMYYKGSTEYRASGAYIFRPSSNHSEAIVATESVNVTTYKGRLFEEIQQQYNDWLTQIIRIYQDESYVEFDWIVGPINTE